MGSERASSDLKWTWQHGQSAGSPRALLSSHGEVLRRKRNKLSTHFLAMGQPGQAASIQQLVGLGSFARVLSNPGDSSGLSKAFWKGRACARRKDASLAAAPGVPQCQEFGGGKEKGGLSSCVTLFLYKGTQGDVLLDIVRMKRRKFL